MGFPKVRKHILLPDLQRPQTLATACASTTAIYLLGGIENFYSSSPVFAPFVRMTIPANYALERASWEQLPTPPRPRFFSASVFVREKLFVVGGSDGSSRHTGRPWLDIYDPANASWSAGPDAPGPMAGCTATVLGNFIHVIGWRNQTDTRTYGTASYHRFDLNANTWSASTPPLAPDGKFGPTSAVALGGKLYLLTGVAGTQMFDPDQNTWWATTPQPIQVGGMSRSVVRIQPSLALVFGLEIFDTYASPGTSQTSTAILAYYAGENRWIRLPDALGAVSGSTSAAAVVTSGRSGLVVVAGGASSMPAPPTAKGEFFGFDLA